MARFRFLVVGRVQGVGFRAATRREALQLGLVGFVANRPDGGVTGEVEGDEVATGSFHAWLHRGPTLAQVVRVDWQAIDPTDPTGSDRGFEIVR